MESYRQASARTSLGPTRCQCPANHGYCQNGSRSCGLTAACCVMPFWHRAVAVTARETQNRAFDEFHKVLEINALWTYHAESQSVVANLAQGLHYPPPQDWNGFLNLHEE